MTEKPKGKPKRGIALAPESCSQFLKYLIIIIGFWIACSAIPIILMICSVFASLLWFTVSPQQVNTCEHVISDTNAVRITSYKQGLRGRIFKYEATTDNGATWPLFYEYHLDNDSPPWVDCEEKFYSVSGNIFYFLFPLNYSRSTTIVITNDAGQTWHEWRVSDIEEYPVGFRCNSIEEVSFQDTTYGGMQVGCSRYDGDTFLRRQNINLFTADGGITWALTYE